VELEREDALRGHEGDFLGDHPAHRGATDVRLPNPELLEQAESLSSHPGDGVGDIGRIALAGAAVIQRDDPVLAGEGRRLKRPGRVVATPAHDEHQRLGARGTSLLIEEADAVDGDLGHGELSERESCPSHQPSPQRGEGDERR
jgi:hypothetical protein